ncbi:MAG: hypothetical protein V4615_10630 [Bacteroidota bacterium]
MTKIDESRLNRQINRLCSKLKTRYPHLCGTSGNRYIRQIVTHLVADNFFSKQGTSYK